MSIPVRLGISITIGSYSAVVPGDASTKIAQQIVDELSNYPFATILFIDSEEVSSNYMNPQSPWQIDFANVYPVDLALTKAFDLELVPEWRWFKDGYEVFRVSGAASEKTITEIASAIRAMTKTSLQNSNDFPWSES